MHIDPGSSRVRRNRGLPYRATRSGATRHSWPGAMHPSWSVLRPEHGR
ncbi:hypothetical protein [Agromyces sp. Soil535]